MISLEELSSLYHEGKIATVMVVFSDLYGRFMGKRFDVDFFLGQIAKHGTHGCDYLLTVDMEMEPVPGYRYANWERGYGDFHLVPDLATLRVASWLDRTAMVLCDVEDEKTHALVPFAPRSILRAQLARSAAEGFDVFAGSELEYYLFHDSYRQAHEKNYSKLEPVGWYLEDYHIQQGAREEFFNAEVRKHLRLSGVPVECTKGEWGLGQHELNVRYADCLTMADNHSIYKQCLHDVADRLGVSVTFMAKFASDQAGSSCHVHLSLCRDEKNAFVGEKPCGPLKTSDIFRWFLGGWMAHARELSVFYAPTVNSYKRFQSASWAPTKIAWGNDNRTGGFRVVGHGPSLRIECRIPGADCNPYLVYAAALASGLDGIENKTEPPEMFAGDIYAAAELPAVPRTLGDAIGLFSSSDFVKRAFGEAVVEHYTHFFQTELSLYEKAVTDWERRRYFERI